MTLATTLLAAALAVPSMPPPEYDDCEVVTNCVFDASRQDAKEFAVRIELDATPSNGANEKNSARGLHNAVRSRIICVCFPN